MKLRYPGVPVFINGKNYFIPSLSLRDFRANAEVIASARREDTPKETWDKYVPVICMAMRRNYPKISEEWLEEHLDLDTFNKAFKACLNASGLEPVTEGEEGPTSEL